MRRHRNDDRHRGRGRRWRPEEQQQFRGEERYREEYAADDDRWGEGGSGYGREGIGRPVSGYGSQGGGFGMGGSPGYEGGRGIGAIGEMGLRGMAGVGGGGSYAGMGYPMSVGGHGTYVAGHQGRDWAPYRGQPDWPRRQHVGASHGSGGDMPRWSSSAEQSFRGRGPRGYRRSDERIREDICDRLTEDHDIDASDIDIKVEGGEVTLEGTVEERRLKWLAEEIASRCSGVVDVHNHLRVQRHQGQATGEQMQRVAEGQPRNGGRGQTQTAQTGLGAQNRTDR
ncbi:MAG TPA: BON domain-containing protein [Kofleriaceae bacterium]|nr:BON domain-containing protein [Kofleriaceae bacterium]